VYKCEGSLLSLMQGLLFSYRRRRHRDTGYKMIKWMQTSDFFLGFVVLILPFLVVMAYTIWREKIQNTWLDGYSAGYQDGSKS